MPTEPVVAQRSYESEKAMSNNPLQTPAVERDCLFADCRNDNHAECLYQWPDATAGPNANGQIPTVTCCCECHNQPNRGLPVETLSEKRISAIEARCKAASKPPWHLEPPPDREKYGFRVFDGGAWGVCEMTRGDKLVDAVNADFIINTPDDISALCRTVRAQQAALRDMGQRALKWLERYPDLDAISLVTENTALREQLVQHEEVNRQLMKDLDRATGECRELQDERDRLRERLAQVGKERDDLRDNMMRLGRARAREMEADSREH